MRETDDFRGRHIGEAVEGPVNELGNVLSGRAEHGTQHRLLRRRVGGRRRGVVAAMRHEESAMAEAGEHLCSGET